MNAKTRRSNLFFVVCLLLSVMLIASSCVAVPNQPSDNGDTKNETTDASNGTPTQNGGNNPTAPADPNKVAFSITVQDDENYAWEGVRVQICEKGESGKCSTPANTDANGKAVITIDKTVLDINNSAIKIVKANGYVVTTNPIDIIPGETSKTITLSEYVVKADSFGQGVEGVVATVSLGNTAIATGTTAASGEVKFLLETDDDYVVTVRSPEDATLLDTTNTSWAFGETFNVTLAYLAIRLVDKTVTVVDENNQPVAGATVLLISPAQEKDESDQYVAAYSGTTDATGKVVFEDLNDSSRYYIVINNVAPTVEGDKVWLEMGVTELTVACSTTVANKTYTVKVGYCDENDNFIVMDGSYVVVVIQFNDDLEQVELAKYTTTNGVATFEMPDDIYFVIIEETSVPEGYRATGAVGFFSDVAELALEEIPETQQGDTAENPLEWNTTHPMTGMPCETTQTLSGLAIGQEVWYQLSFSVGMELFVQTNTPGAVIAVTYNGRTVYTDEGVLTLVFDETSPMQQPALICISREGRVYQADVMLTVREAGSGDNANSNPDNLPGAGTDNSPFILTEGGTYTAVVTVNNAVMTPTVYEITILANGTLTVAGLGENHWIRMECIAKSICTDSTNPEENVTSISHTVNAGEVWRIIVGTWDEQAGEVAFDVTLA